MSDRKRGQSEVVGVVLLTAVFVVVATVIGVFLLSSYESKTEDQPRLAIQSELNDTALILKHNGGDRFDAADIEVILRGENRTSVLLSDGQFVSGTDETAFQPGDVWIYRHGLSTGKFELYVFDQQAETLLYDDTLEIGGR